MKIEHTKILIYTCSLKISFCIHALLKLYLILNISCVILFWSSLCNTVLVITQWFKKSQHKVNIKFFMDHFLTRVPQNTYTLCALSTDCTCSDIVHVCLHCRIVHMYDCILCWFELDFIQITPYLKWKKNWTVFTQRTRNSCLCFIDK